MSSKKPLVSAFKPRLCPNLFPAVLLAIAVVSHAQTPITLEVDASAITRKILSAHEVLPVGPGSPSGEMTLVFPKWIPGDHGPTGPITDLVRLHFSWHGQTIPWERDPADMYAFHLKLPPGATEVEADFASVGEYAPGNDFNLGNTSTPVQGDINFDQIVLYPAGARSDDVRVRPTVKLPSGWSFATALPQAKKEGDSVRFGEVSLTTLVDSPLMTGSLLKEFDITPQGESRRHSLDIFAESAAGLALPPQRVDAYRNLVAETGALFGARHYASYHFLVEAHDDASNGLEHHQSSDDQVPEMGMVAPAFSAESGYLLAHEMTHSWNGKYRRPAGLATANYQDPMLGNLLWVYEGLTSYFGEILTTRSGLDTPEQFRDRLASDEAIMDTRTGRDWRPLQDSATAAQLLYLASPHWEALRRTTDYYIEGPLLWLEVDGVLRRESHGQKSIDDFAHAFYGAPDSEPKVVPYTFGDVVHALNGVVAYDWAGFFRQRLDALRPAPVSQGLEAAGWHVVYTDQPNGASRDAEATTNIIDLRYSIGLTIDEAGDITDVLPDSAAGRAGIAPEWKLAAVNHRVYTPDILRSAITAAKADKQPIVLMMLRNGYYADFPVDYHDGLRYPHLERITSKPDLLPAILKARR